MIVWTMLQIVLSFVGGVYVGTEYNMRPYLDHLREAASRLERRPTDRLAEEEAPVKSTEPTAKGWFSWSNPKSEKEA